MRTVRSQKRFPSRQNVFKRLYEDRFNFPNWGKTDRSKSDKKTEKSHRSISKTSRNTKKSVYDKMIDKLMVPIRTSRSIDRKLSIGSPERSLERCYNNSIERLYKINLNELTKKGTRS